MTLFLEINWLLGVKLTTTSGPFHLGRTNGLFAQEQTSVWNMGLSLLFLLAWPEPEPQTKGLCLIHGQGIPQGTQKGEPTLQ